MLELLRSAKGIVSGETIAASLGVSRVAVWKAVKSLNAAGYRVASSPAGYALASDNDDSLAPCEFGLDEKNILHLDETGSTMDAARKEALAGKPDGFVVLAERQTDGRGTDAKKWESAEGGLFFTAVTRPKIGAAWYHRQILRAQLAACASIRSVAGIDAFPGWPNDILAANGKVGGILAETLSLGSAIVFENLGVGLNTLSARVFAAEPNRSGIKPMGIPSGRKEIFTAFLSQFRDSAATPPALGDDDSLSRLWNARCPIVGKETRFIDAEGSLQRGIFLGVDAAGWALIAPETDTTPASRGEYILRCPPGSITLLDKGTNA